MGVMDPWKSCGHGDHGSMDYETMRPWCLVAMTLRRFVVIGHRNMNRVKVYNTLIHFTCVGTNSRLAYIGLAWLVIHEPNQTTHEKVTIMGSTCVIVTYTNVT